MGTASVIPELAYPDVAAAVRWLCDAFGFVEVWRVGDHRARVAHGNGLVIVADTGFGRSVLEPSAAGTHSVMVRVTDADAHCAKAREHGAMILSEPQDHAYGERQYTAADLAGHRWTFSQSIADVAPEDWGGVSAR